MSAIQQMLVASKSLPPPSGNQTFTYTGSDQSWAVPSGVTSISVKLWGGGGGSNYESGSPAAKGGAGGFVKFTVSVTPGESLTVKVGGKGNNAGTGGRRPGAGGGMSALLRSATYLGIAGGGGGAGGYGDGNSDSWGGSGGDTTANAGESNPYSNGGGAGSQSAGGTGGTPGPAGNGSSLQGGDGYGASLTTLGGWPGGGNSSSVGEHGGGGGAGYYGGGGGGGGGTWGAGGGGGSSYTVGSATSVVHIKSAANDTSAPGTGETGYVAPVAVGGLNFTDAGNGLVYISWPP